jgi:RES domain
MADFRSWGSYVRFEHVVRSESRYVRSTETEEFLQTVLVTAENRVAIISAGTVMWRARLGHEYRNASSSPDLVVWVPYPYPAGGLKPIIGQATEGRANPKGIPYLYLATERDIAMAEVRPWLGSSVSIGQFKAMRALRVVDCSRGCASAPLWSAGGPEPPPAERERAVWIDIDRAFAEPVDRRDDVADYVPTQIIGELFKHAGYDGVMYRSAFSTTGNNLALFDTSAAELISCALFYPKKIDIEFRETDPGYVV